MTSPVASLHPRNAVTYLALLLGLAATLAARAGRPSVATGAIALAALADTFDGRFARLFRASPAHRAVGAQLDSLADACTFGLAPVVCVLAAASGASSLILVTAAFAYLSATVTRLAFFNVSHGTTTGFIGLPAPAGALSLSTAMALSAGVHALAGVMVLTAVAMVSPWRLPRPAGVWLVAFASGR
ncbi:MAG: CDP-alcohol phosphatidyltransferase family protein, partial [Vicinamibacterales bacterium]